MRYFPFVTNYFYTWASFSLLKRDLEIKKIINIFKFINKFLIELILIYRFRNLKIFIEIESRFYKNKRDKIFKYV